MQKDRHRIKTGVQKKLYTLWNDLLGHLPSQDSLVGRQDNTPAEAPAAAVVVGSRVAAVRAEVVLVGWAAQVELRSRAVEPVVADRAAALVVLVEVVGLAQVEVVVPVWGWALPYFVQS